jgi:hypothetical protein
MFFSLADFPHYPFLCPKIQVGKRGRSFMPQWFSFDMGFEPGLLFGKIDGLEERWIEEIFWE